MDPLQPSHWINLVFSRLSVGDVGRISQLNQYFRAVVNTNETWRMLYRRDLSEIVVPSNYREAYREFLTVVEHSTDFYYFDWRIVCSRGYEKIFLTLMDIMPDQYDVNIVVKNIVEANSLHLLTLIPDSASKRCQIVSTLGDPKHPMVAEILEKHGLTNDLILCIIYHALKVEDDSLLLDMIRRCYNFDGITGEFIIPRCYH